MTNPANFFTEKNTANKSQLESTLPIGKAPFFFCGITIFINHSNADVKTTDYKE